MENKITDEDIQYLAIFFEHLHAAVGDEAFEIIYEELCENPPQCVYAPHLITETTDEETELFLENLHQKLGEDNYSKFERFMLVNLLNEQMDPKPTKKCNSKKSKGKKKPSY